MLVTKRLETKVEQLSLEDMDFDQVRRDYELDLAMEMAEINFIQTDADKLAIEGVYHKYTNAGHISYIELDGDPSDNLEAFESVVRIMHDSDIGYGAINHPVDRDPVCGYVGIIKDVCPRCGRHTGEGVSVDLLKNLEGKEG